MIIYADVLILLNTVVDYFLIKITAMFIKEDISFLRLLFSSLIGGVSSVYIFLPSSSILIEIPVKILISLVLSLSAFGFMSIKRYLRNTLFLFAVTYLFGGIMIAVWLLFKPNNMIINNSVLYINISPVILIISSCAYYFAVMLFRYFLRKNGISAQNCKIKIKLGESEKQINGIVDTGNSLTDIFGISEIIIVSKKTALDFLKFKNDTERKKRYRAIPVKTVSGTAIIDGYRIDKAIINTDNETKSIKSPILAVSNTNLDGEWDAIINPKSIA
ncbi:MAG: sigma-E processing peptidase SpoIIGA [Clostridia bacterium]|nr:sigma-E processing peptidase SpoIIGA [Clostridia bacterium]